MHRHHSRIYPANQAILAAYSPDHAAVRALQVHAEACDICVGKEIAWPQLGNRPIDQEWFSLTRLREQSFSALAYEFLSFDLVLDGWLEMPPHATEWECGFLTEDDVVLRVLLDECERAAQDEGNEDILPLIAKAREYLDAFKQAVLFRFRECGIQWPVNSSPSNDR